MAEVDLKENLTKNRIVGYHICDNNTDLAELVLLAQMVVTLPHLAPLFVERIGPILKDTPQFFMERESQRMALYQAFAKVPELASLIPKQYVLKLMQDKLTSLEDPRYAWQVRDLVHKQTWKF